MTHRAYDINPQFFEKCVLHGSTYEYTPGPRSVGEYSTRSEQDAESRVIPMDGISNIAMF